MEKDVLCNTDDVYLFCNVVEYITKKEGTYDNDVKQALETLKKHFIYKMPNFATVLRTRTALHREFSHFKKEKTAEKRKQEQELYCNYFKNKK